MKYCNLETNMRKYKLWCAALITIVAPVLTSAKTTVVNPLTEGLENPVGIDTSTPRFSWQTVSDKNDVVQTRYRILVASTPEKLAAEQGDLWDSGNVTSDAQLWIPYGGKQLKSNTKAYWKVKVETNRERSGWSEPQHFTVGLCLLYTSDAADD